MPRTKGIPAWVTMLEEIAEDARETKMKSARIHDES
jgi:hypothetical protein